MAVETDRGPARAAPARGGLARGRGRCLRWWQEAGVQVRSTIAATVLQAVVVAAAGMVLLLALHDNLDTSIDVENLATAQGISALVDAGLAGSSAGGATTGSAAPSADRRVLQDAIDTAARRRAVVQVLDADGRVIASSDDLRGADPVVEDTPAPGQQVVLQRSLPFDDDPYRITALGAEVDGRRFTVVVGLSLGTGEDTVHAAEAALAVAGPLLLIAVAGATYLFIGRSLRPVARIRTTVERISHRDLSERVPVPPGGDDVSQLARTMNGMLDGLERAGEAQRRFVSDASHELRSPVATLRAAADIALTVPGRGSREDLAVLVRAETQRLDRLVADLLLLARTEERRRRGPDAGARRSGGDPSPDRSGDEVDLDDLVTEEARRLRTSTSLQVRVRRTPVRVVGDAHDLSRAVRNLTDNAARHAASCVSIEAHREGSTAVVTVSNDGPPIEPADRERVFDRFVRLEESRARDLGGTGLGLAIVAEVAAAHGGTVRITEPTGSTLATCFRLELPAADLPVRDLEDDL